MHIASLNNIILYYYSFFSLVHIIKENTAGKVNFQLKEANHSRINVAFTDDDLDMSVNFEQVSLMHSKTLCNA